MLIRGSFKQKFILLLLLVSLIPTIFIGGISYEIAKNVLYKRIELDFSTQASHIMDQIDRFLYERYNDTQLLISDTIFLNPGSTIEDKTKTLKQYSINLGLYENIHLLDMKGNVIATTYTDNVNYSLEDEPWFKQTKKNFYYISNIHYSYFTGNPTILFSNVLFDNNHQPQGVIVAELLWPAVTEFLKNVPLPTQAILLNNADIEIGGRDPEAVLQRSWSSEAIENFSNSQYLGTFVKSRGYLVYRGNDWKLVLRTPIKDALQPLNRLFTLIAVMVLGFVLVIFVTGIIIGNRFVNPIKKVTKGAEEIEKGNLNQRINVSSKDEIGFLAQSFNKMAQSLKHQQARLKNEILKGKELEKVKDNIWSTASHNLRTPLTGINWTLEMLNKEILGKLNEKQQDAFNQIKNNANQLNYLLNILLDVSKVEGGKIKLIKTDFYLEEVIKSVLNSKNQMIKEKRLIVDAPNLNTRHIKLHLDQNKIYQVFSILIDNAAIYNNDSGKVTISIKKFKRKVACKITDTGIGMSEKDLRNVFDKYMKGSNSETKNARGIGLGLYIAKIIVTSSKGKLSAKSSLGKGSSFCIELPLA